MITEKYFNSGEIFENRFLANYRIFPWLNKDRGLTMLLLFITLLITTFCSSTTMKNNLEPVVEYYSIPGFHSFKTASHIIILQIDISDESILPKLEDVDHVTLSDDQFILWVNEDSIHVSVSDNDDVKFLVDGIIFFANKDISLSDLSSILHQMPDKSDLNCWAGGAGAKSCTVRHGTSEVKTICREGLNPCCTREIIGICTVD